MKLRDLRLIFWIAVLLGVLELGLEWRAYQKGWPTQIFGKLEEWAPVGEPEFGPTSDFPFRSRIAPKLKPAGTTRLWVASSSYAEDVQLAPDAIFPGLIESELNARGISVDMLNASRGGMDTRANLADLEELAADWKPDIAILYQASNDIDVLVLQLLAGESAADEGVVAREDQAQTVVNPLTLITQWTEGTSVYAHLKSQITTRLTQSRVLEHGLGARGEVRMEQLVQSFVDSCAALKIRPLLCTFGTSHDRSNLRDLPADWGDNLFRYNIHLSIEGWIDSVQVYNRVIKKVAAQNGIPLADVAAALGGHPEYFRDFTHLSAKGHRVAADAILPVLTGMLSAGTPQSQDQSESD